MSQWGFNQTFQSMFCCLYSKTKKKCFFLFSLAFSLLGSPGEHTSHLLPLSQWKVCGLRLSLTPTGSLSSGPRWLHPPRTHSQLTPMRRQCRHLAGWRTCNHTRPKDFLSAEEERCKPHFIKLLINTSVLGAQWREGSITLLNLCLVIRKPEKGRKAGVEPSLLSCFQQVSVFSFPLSLLLCVFVSRF